MTPTEAFSWGIFHDWDPDRLLAILTAYFDESGTHDGCPVTVMAGWVGKAGRWAQFDRKWAKMLKKHGLNHVHAKDVVQGSGEFTVAKGWTKERRGPFAEKAHKMAQNHALFGVVVFLRDDDYEQVYVNTIRSKPRRLRLDTKYGLCFRGCLLHLFRVLENMELMNDLHLHLILEQGHKHAGDATRIYNEIFCKHAPKEHVDAVKTFAFGKKKEHPGLQGADLLAYPSLLTELDNAAELDPMPVTEAKFSRIPKIHRIAIGITQLEELRGMADNHRRGWRRRRNTKIKKDSSD